MAGVISVSEDEAEASSPEPVPHEPLDVIATREGYLAAVAEISAGTGPIAVDAERASGFRYSQRAYLIQVFRRGAGTFLFDPPAVGGFEELNAAIRDEEWIFHAASQDLACLREVGLDPAVIFDTELGARLAGFPRVGLGTVVEELLGIHLAKEHSAADWSTRPLPQSWLVYAALDVELLVDLREALAAVLQEQRKVGIAEQEFAAVLTKEARPPRVEAWRRLTGLSTIRAPRNLAVARELWLARDEYAREIDTSPVGSCPTARSSPPLVRSRRRSGISRPSRSSTVGPADRRSGGGGMRSRRVAPRRICPRPEDRATRSHPRGPGPIATCRPTGD